MSKLLAPLLKIYLRKISGKSIELHTDDLSQILVLQNISENLSQNDFWKVNRIEPLVPQCPVHVGPHLHVLDQDCIDFYISLQEKLLTVTLVTVTQYRASWLQ